jgi:hypothetical protein
MAEMTQPSFMLNLVFPFPPASETQSRLYGMPFEPRFERRKLNSMAFLSFSFLKEFWVSFYRVSR